MSCLSSIPLINDWSFSQLPGRSDPKPVKEEWKAIEKIPTSVHVELLKRGEIADPYKGLAEHEVQWVGEADWAFKTTFTLSAEQLSSPSLDIVFSGLDTICTVQLNDKPILSASNMFTSYRVSLLDHLDPNVSPSDTHTLHLTFPSSWYEAKRLESQQRAKKLPENIDAVTGEDKELKSWNGPSSRLYMRKSQYGWGWDWGPVLMTVGPWKPIFIEAYTAKITSSKITTPLGKTYDSPSLRSTISHQLSSESSSPISDLSYRATLTSSTDEVIHSESSIPVSGNTATINWDLSNKVSLWWPHTHGTQRLYTLKVELVAKDGKVLDERKDRVGFRTVRVVQDKLEGQEGTSFLFEVNGKRIFAGGSNWIPADNFLTEVTPAKYHSWLSLLVQGNQNMIRVWGGGIYEPDCFYDTCDELGILVWQDFMFGCGQYPAFEELVESVEVEARQAVERLRNHPCMAIFAGNNEDYTLAESIGLYVAQDDDCDFRKTNFPARHLYEKVLPAAVNELSDIYYHRGSPYGGKDSQDPTVGDIHQWNVWHGSQEPWSNWDKLSGRFVSEFGMEGYPNIRTVDYYLDGNTAERFPQSRTNCSHNKAEGFERRLELYLMENFRHAFDMESYVYYTQAMQAETLAAAYRLWRRNWKGHGKEYTSGALVWQINDCWPTTSWALVDYFLRPKPAFFAIARELRPFTVGMARKDVKTFDNEDTAAAFKIEQTLEIWGNNSAFEEKKVTLEVVSFDLTCGEVVEKRREDVALKQNASTELYKGIVPGQPTRTNLAQLPKVIVVGARLLDGDGKVLARYANWPEPWKYITFPKDAGLKLVTGSDGETVTITSTYPIKGLILDVADRSTDAKDGEVEWSDQALDLMPGDEQVVVAKGLKGRELAARYLGDGSAETV